MHTVKFGDTPNAPTDEDTYYDGTKLNAVQYVSYYPKSKIAYTVAYSGDTFASWDLSDPTDITFLDELVFASAERPQFCAINSSGTHALLYLYSNTTKKFVSVDVSTMTVVDTFLESSLSGAAIDKNVNMVYDNLNDVMYLGGAGEVIYALDFSDPTDITELASVDLGPNYALAINGDFERNLLFVFSADSTLHVLNATTLSSLSSLGGLSRLPTQGFPPVYSPKQQHLFHMGSSDRFKSYDVSDPSAPTFNSELYDTGFGNASSIIVLNDKDDRIYVVGGSRFSVINISDPSSMTTISNATDSGYAVEPSFALY